MSISQNFPDEGPTLNLNFASSKTLDPRITFTRASTGTYFDDNGQLVTAAANAPRFDHNPTTGESLGLLLEEARTNSIANNTGVGAVAGTPGTLPTGWSRTVTQNGITQNVVGSGVINGISYVDIRFQGTATGVGYTDVFMGSAVAAQNQTWAFSTYLAMVGGSTANVTGGGLTLYGSPSFSDNGSAIWFSTIGPNLTTSSRFSAVRTFTNATTNLADLRLTIYVTAGAAVDITLRIGLPQLELGAFATSVIPTTTATATRSADVAQITGANFGSWYRQDEGTVFIEYRRLANVSGSSRILLLSDTTATEQIRISASLSTNIRPDWQVIDGGVVQANVIGAAEVAIGAIGKTAGVYKVNDFQQATNGSLGGADTTGTLPTITALGIGSNESGGSVINGTIRRISFWPTRLPNSTLQTLTK